MAKIINNPRPGDKFPSPIEKGGYWITPPGCYRVIVADATGYPITHFTSTRHAERQRSTGRRPRAVA